MLREMGIWLSYDLSDDEAYFKLVLLRLSDEDQSRL